MILDPRFLHLSKVLDMVEDAIRPIRREDWRSLCCNAKMYGKPPGDPSYGRYGKCRRCGGTSEFVDVEAQTQ